VCERERERERESVRVCLRARECILADASKARCCSK
jgi:hypothetical protein